MTPTPLVGYSVLQSVAVLVATVPMTLGHIFTCISSSHRTVAQEKGVILQKDAREYTCKVYLWA